MSEETLLLQLRQKLGPHLLSPEQVTPTPGVSTGWRSLDEFLLWQGFPRGAVSLLVSEGGGATGLWLKSATQVTKRQQWAAWVNGGDTSLYPWRSHNPHLDLSRLLWVSAPQDAKQALWALQELMSLCLFELVGCDLGRTTFKEHQVLKLKKLALRYQTSLVLLTHSPSVRVSSFYSLILQFRKKHVVVQRALHRPTPFILERRDLYADTLSQLAAGRRPLCGGKLPDFQSPGALSLTRTGVSRHHLHGEDVRRRAKSAG